MTSPYLEKPLRTEDEFRADTHPRPEPHEIEAFPDYDDFQAEVASWQLKLLVLLACVWSVAISIGVIWFIASSLAEVFSK